MIPWITDRIRNFNDQHPNAAAQTPLASPNGNQFAVPSFGGFLNAASYPGGFESACATAPDNCGLQILLTGDLNGDGKPDLIVIQYDGTLYTLLNDGAGGFGPPTHYAPPQLTQGLTYAVGADFNQDGRMDVAEVDQANNTINIFLNTGDGTLVDPVAIPVNTPDYENLVAIAVGDVNGDGKPDLVALTNVIQGGGGGIMGGGGGPASTTFTFLTFLGKGDGTFATPTQAQTTVQQITTGAATFGVNMQLADLHHTGKLDLLFSIGLPTTAVPSSSSGPRADVIISFTEKCGAVAPGNGDGTFGAFTTPIQAGSGVSPNDEIQALDLNNDGNLDIVMVANERLYSALNNGSGGFQQAVSAGISADELQFADTNGDGYPDLISQFNGTKIFPGNGDGTFSPPPAVYVSDEPNYEGTVVADFDGDGILDIANVVNDPRIVEIYKGQGGGKYAAAPVLYSVANPAINNSALKLQTSGDFNGDGYTDLLAINFSSPPSLTSALSDGKGGFTYKTALTVGQFPTLQYAQPITADFNGDGFQDIILTGSVGILGVALSNGDGAFKTPVTIPLGPLACALGYAAAADLTGKGHLDIVIPYGGDGECSSSVNITSGYFVIPGNGDGTFGTPQFYAFGSQLYSATLADLNGDGIPDLVLNDETFGSASPHFQISYLPGNGDATFGEARVINAGSVISQVIAADVNGDGIPDLVLFSEGNYAGATGPGNQQDADTGIDLFINHGDGIFDPLVQLSVGNYYVNGYVGDVNGDGIPDITAALYQMDFSNNPFDGFTTWLGLGQGYFSPVSTPIVRDADLTLPGKFVPDGTVSFAVDLPTLPGVAIMLNQGGDSLSLTSPASSASQGAAVNLSVAITTSFGHGAPAGTVTFTTNGATLGSAPVNGGTATFSTSSLPVGFNTITAIYSGDSHYNVAKASTAITVVAIQPALAVSASPSSLTLTAGATGTAVVTIAANAAFSGTASLSCTGAPAQSTCSVSPASIQLSAGQSGTVTVVVATTAPNNTYQAGNRTSGAGMLGMASAGTMAAVFLIILPWGRRFPKSPWYVAAFIAIGSAGIIGCGGGGSRSAPTTTYSGTPAGTYTLTVMATAGPVTSNSTIKLQVR